jgi:hypothetical protein
MNRKSLASLIILDLLVMALAGGLLYIRFGSLQKIAGARANFPAAIPRTTLPQQPVGAIPAAAPAATDVNVSTAVPIISVPAMRQPAKETRHIGFHFRSSKAQRVQIIGDFNEWNPQSMNLGLDFTWGITLDIPPGDYAYNFVVDGKPVRDPNNKKVCDAGRGFPNSYLRVKQRVDTDQPAKK